jgi:Lar family restriction alleviation protein
VNLPPGMPTPRAAGELELREVHCFPMTAQLSLARMGITTLGALCARAELLPFSTQREQLVAAFGLIDETVAGWAADAILEHLHPTIKPTPQPEPEPETPMSKIELVPPRTLELHPEAGLVPEMPADQYKLFLKDVRDKGVQEPIKRLPGTNIIIDGRTRRTAAIDAGLALVPVTDVDLGEEDPVVYMIRVAYLRRQLTHGQRAAYGAKISKRLKEVAAERKKAGAKKGGATAGRGRPKATDSLVADRPQGSPETKPARAPKSRDEAARLSDSSPKAVTAAEKVMEKSPEVFAKLDRGEISLPAAKKAIAEPKPTSGTPFSAIPKFPTDALAPLSGNGIRTVEDLDARVAKMRSERGRGDGIGRFTVLRECGLAQPLVMKVGNVLEGHFAPKAEPKPAKKTESEKPVAVAGGLQPGEKAGIPSSRLHPLDPCPFCGSGDAMLVFGFAEKSGAKTPIEYVRCKGCGATGPKPDKTTKTEEVRAAWNKRTNP